MSLRTFDKCGIIRGLGRGGVVRRPLGVHKARTPWTRRARVPKAIDEDGRLKDVADRVLGLGAEAVVGGEHTAERGTPARLLLPNASGTEQEVREWVRALCLRVLTRKAQNRDF